MSGAPTISLILGFGSSEFKLQLAPFFAFDSLTIDHRPLTTDP